MSEPGLCSFYPKEIEVSPTGGTLSLGILSKNNHPINIINEVLETLRQGQRIFKYWAQGNFPQFEFQILRKLKASILQIISDFRGL